MAKKKKVEKTEKQTDEVKVITVRNVMRKRNHYVNPAYRLERDEAETAKITSQRQYKGKIEKVVTTKYMEVNADGDLVTEIAVHLK